MRRRLSTPLVLALLAIVLTELTARAAGSRLPEPLRWPTWETQNKVASLDEVARSGRQPDVVLVGSSVMNYSFDSELLRSRTGRRVFNAALDGSEMQATEWWVNNVVLRRVRPKTMVIGVSSVEFNDRGPETGNFYDRLTKSDGGRAVINRGSFLDRLESFAERWVSVFRLRTALRKPSNIVRGYDPAQRAEAVGPDGQRLALLEKPYGLTDAQLKLWTAFKGLDYQASAGKQIRAFERLVTKLRSMEIGVVVVRTPVTKDLLRWHNRGAKDYEAFLRAVDRVIERFGLTFVEAEMATGTKSFIDPLHLNEDGRRYMSSAIVPVVSEAPEAPPAAEQPAAAPPAPADAQDEVTTPQSPAVPSADPPSTGGHPPVRVIVPPPPAA